jgi:hypothetical protein
MLKKTKGNRTVSLRNGFTILFQIQTLQAFYSSHQVYVIKFKPQHYKHRRTLLVSFP